MNFTYTVIDNQFMVQVQACTVLLRNEPPNDQTKKMACVPSEDSDQPGHPSILTRVFAVRKKKDWVLSYTLSADLSLRWAHSHFVGFVINYPDHEAAQIIITTDKVLHFYA